MEEFITIKENVQTELIENKSKFIANFFYVQSVKEIEDKIKEIKKKHYDSSHNCIAYRVIENNKLVERFSDDGEPSGTAGVPMLDILRKNNLANVLIVVTRYFGGILLGTGGLVRAYSNSLLNLINKSELLKEVAGEELEIILEYNNFESFKYYCKNNDINIINTSYLQDIVCKIELELNVKERLLYNFETKKINLKELKFLSKKYLKKSI